MTGFRRLMFLSVALLLPAASKAEVPAAPSPSDSTVVIIVRHAEKADQSADPDLSPAGRERSLRLAAMLESAGVVALYVTEYRRTRQTLSPLAERLGIPLQQIPSQDIDGLLSALRSVKPGGTVVAASHSNVIPLLLQRLGRRPEVRIAESDYDNLFVALLNTGELVGFLHLRY